MTPQEIYEKATNKPFSEYQNGFIESDIENLKSFLYTLSSEDELEFLLYILDSYYLLEKKDFSEFYSVHQKFLSETQTELNNLNLKDEMFYDEFRKRENIFFKENKHLIKNFPEEIRNKNREIKNSYEKFLSLPEIRFKLDGAV
jgi:hypothetical protein